MSFRIFARGTGDFHHSSDNADEGDVYDMAALMSRISSATGGVSGIVQNEALSAVPNNDFGLATALNVGGGLIMADLLRTNFTLALAHAGHMTIYVAATGTNAIIPDSMFPPDSANMRRTYRTSDYTPFADFMTDLNPVLESAGLNRFMLLGAIAQVFGAWNGQRARVGERMLNIILTDT